MKKPDVIVDFTDMILTMRSVLYNSQVLIDSSLGYFESMVSDEEFKKFIKSLSDEELKQFKNTISGLSKKVNEKSLELNSFLTDFISACKEG